MSSVKGEQVAARVTPHNADKDEWFVVRVIHFDKDSKEYEVLDEEPGDDDEEESGQRQYKLPMGNIIAFPKSNDPCGATDFPPGTHVLAVYLGTTALIKQQLCMAIARGSEMIMCWSLMMMWRKKDLYLKGQCPSTKWLLCQRDIANGF